MNTAEYEDLFFASEDGTRIHTRDYRFDSPEPYQDTGVPILCLHGLTRNCRDFEPMIEALRATNNNRFIVPDQRGRGLSDDSTPDTYSPVVYAQDMWALMNFLEIGEFLLIGTSMGGIMSMLMSSNPLERHRIKGICLNDIGPAIEPSGLEAILDYLGKNMSADNWQEAVANTQENQQKNFPDFSKKDWLDFVKRIYRTDEETARLRLDYDPAISEPIRLAVKNQESSDLWPLFEYTRHCPVLIVRGELSDLLSREVVSRMREQHPGAKSVEIANRGHAPMLDEPAALQSLRSWISDCHH